MEPWLEMAITVFCSVAASSGFWAFMQRQSEKKDTKAKMILGLGHDRLLFLCIKYIERGYITHDELENLNEYLYSPYLALKGNGTVSRLMLKVDALPVKRSIYVSEKEEVEQHE